MPIKEVKELDSFSRSLGKLDKSLIDRLYKQIKKVIENPDAGKPLRYDLKGERTIYVKPYRLIYKAEGDTLFLLRFLHRKDVYR